MKAPSVVTIVNNLFGETSAKTIYDRAPGFLAVALAAAMFLQAYLGSRTESLTVDEPSFISSGYSYLTTRQFVLNPSHPPLTQELIAFPLLFLGLHEPQGGLEHWLGQSNPAADYGSALIYETGNDPLKIAFWARLTPEILGAALVLVVFLWGKELLGPWPALVSSVLAAFCPNLVAHAKVATEDISCSFFMLLAVWSFWHAYRARTVRAAALSGIVTGLALLSKFTALLLLPAYLIVLVSGMVRERALLRRWTAVLAAVFLGACFLVVAAGYDFQPTLYLKGVSSIYTDTHTDYAYYLYGMVSSEPWWYYNLAAFLVKVPVPAIVLIVTALLLIIVTKHHEDLALSFLLVPPLVIIVASFFDKRNFGLRRILPALPFLYMLVAYAVRRIDLKGAAKLVLAVLLSWTVYDCISIYPHHLSYFNEIAGGPLNAAAFLDDSNIDWGQDLPSLAAWQHKHPEARPLKLFYFGRAKPESYGVDAQKFNPSEAQTPERGVYYAVSVHNLVWLRKFSVTEGRNLDWLSRFQPIDRAGYSIYIYKF